MGQILLMEWTALHRKKIQEVCKLDTRILSILNLIGDYTHYIRQQFSRIIIIGNTWKWFRKWIKTILSDSRLIGNIGVESDRFLMSSGTTFPCYQILNQPFNMDQAVDMSLFSKLKI
jgi:hypothetical protein